MCCGSKRSAWRATETVARAPSPAPQGPRPGSNGALVARAQAPASPSRGVPLEYTRDSPIRVWGPATGRPYDFSGAHSVQAMDPRDAAALSRTGLFRRVQA